MKLPLAWLRDYIDFSESGDDIAERLALLGFPVDGIERRPRLSGIVAGRLTSVVKHPNADRLQVCTVDVARSAPLTIATAATNVAQGQVVPVATIGAELVGLTIAPRTMRGIDSEGMLVSAGEIGLPDEWFEDGILQLESDVPLGSDFVERYRLHDDVLDVEITANRVDAMSVIGLARELAAALGTTVREPDLYLELTAAERAAGAGTSVDIQTPDCKRFVAQRFSGVRVEASPFWMRLRLALAGQRPIDNLVDISNFVMLETGQPLHFYDFEKLAERRVIVRDARPGERLKTLDGEERTLDPRDLVIADAADAQCLAGLRGAAASEVSAQTRELLLEAATFSGPRIRRMSVALGLRTEASTRHEKNLPAALGPLGAARAAYLLKAGGATVHPSLETGPALERPAAIDVAPERVRGLLGIALDDGEMQSALRGLGFEVSGRDGILNARPPGWRSDIVIAEDVIEEIGRIAGYDRIAESEPPVLPHAISSKTYHDEKRVAHALAAHGYREAASFSLQAAGVRERFAAAGVAPASSVVEIVNPLSEDQRFMRFSLLPGLLALAARYQRERPLRVFEIGHVFENDGAPIETAMFVWLAAVDAIDGEPEWRDAGFLNFKGESLALLRVLCGSEAEVVSTPESGLHPGKSAALLIAGRDVARIGAVDPRLVAQYELTGNVYAGLARLHELPDYRIPRYIQPSRFPPIERDVALIVAPEIPALDIEHAVRAGAGSVVAGVRVFDEYRGPQVEAGKKSIAVRFVLQRADATLTDAEADAYVAAIIASLAERCGAKLRA